MMKDRIPKDLQENKPENKVSCIKVTIPFILLSCITMLVYFSGKSNMLSANFIKISEYELWRLFTSLFSSLNAYLMIINILYIYLLSHISESRNGSFPFLIDLMLKNLLINGMAVLFYLVIFLCARIFGSAFDYFLEIQNTYDYSGYGAILSLEVFFLLISDSDQPKEQRSWKRTCFLRLLFLALLFLNFFYAQFLAAAVLAALFNLGMFGYLIRVQKSQFNFNLEQRLKGLKKVLYFYFIRAEESRDFFGKSEKEIISKESVDKNDNTLSDDADFEFKKEDDEEDDSSESDEVNKSRYEEIDMSDYVMEEDEKEGGKNKKDPETFEI